MPRDPRSSALADLNRAIAALGALAQPADRQDLAELQAIALRLARPAPPLREFDPARFRTLIDLAGPSLAGELLAHLASDLERCRAQALEGAETRDWGLMRASSHVLISLAGSVGALSLQSLAEKLHLAATLGAGDPAGALDAALIVELDALIALVRATPAPTGDAA